MGCSTPTTTAADASPENAVTKLITSLTSADAEFTPRSRARCIRSWKSGSSKAASSTWLVRSYSCTSTTWSTCGSSRLCAHPAAVATPERIAVATATRISDGSAARTRCGVGPAANSACSTPVVANRAYPPNTPEARLSAIVAAVSRLLADQPRLNACPISAGNRRATSLNFTVAIRWS